METTNASNDAALQLALLAIFLIPAILFLLTQANTLKQVLPENRTLAPGLVWLQLIPIVGQIWQFFVVARIAGSIQKQWQTEDKDSILGINAEAVADGSTGKPMLVIGIVYCSLSILVIVFNLFTRSGMPTLSGLLGLATMTCWIIYWVQLAGWKRRLKQRAGFAAA
ncbi:MAG TPA: hypothetical protein VGS79_17070 [Puia sp.]|nr:hypothetical protein [Puia sp.]